jgi:hypothetical protein
MITVKKLTLISKQIDLVKRSALNLSYQLSALNSTLLSLDVSTDNPIFDSANQVTEDYKQIAGSIGQLEINRDKLEQEIVVSDEN